jgi:DNA-binding beta-propeller fold protein YncE
MTTRNSLVLLGALLTCVSSASAADAPNYKIIDRIKVQDGGFDYATVDPATSRLYMARTDFTTVIDLKTKAVSQLKSAARGHIALPIPGTNLAILTQRTGTVRIVDLATDMALADIPVGKNPDGAVYDPVTKLVFAMSHDMGTAAVIDTATRKPVASINVGGELEFPVSDGAGKVFVNIESSNEIGVIDVRTKQLLGKYKLAGCEEPSGLAYIAGSKLLMASCANGVAKVVEAETGKDVASVPIGRGPDAVFQDPSRKLAFIPCGRDGVLEVISLADPAHIAVVQHVQTQAGSRTGTIDPSTGRLYLMASKPDANAAPTARGARLAGSFEVLVIAP